MKTLKLRLGYSRGGRILLHLWCMLHKGHLQWHLRGIAREFHLTQA